VNIQNKDARTVIVTNLPEVTAGNATQVCKQIHTALPSACTLLEIDLSTTTFLDSSGLGTLIFLNKTLRSRNGCVRLLKPVPNIRHLLELTQLHRIFEIVS
jgi:anti-sigma B factor antagonist